MKSPAVPWLAVALLLSGCAPSQGPGLSVGVEAPGQRAGPKRVVGAIMGDAHTVYQKLNPGSFIPGIETIEELLQASLATTNAQGSLKPQLAEAVPTLENGLWKVFQDGRMETTWTLRAGAQWHDGVSVTTDDLLFTARVSQDRELAVLRVAAFDLVEGIEAVDTRTVTVKWRQPWIEADGLFGRSPVPMPKHLLERAYVEDRAAFTEHAYWSTDFVGTGPFVLKEFVPGSHLVARANDRYALGRPKMDEIEVRFIPDPNTLVANIMAGEVEVLLGRGLSLEQGLEIRDRWREGQMEIEAPRTWMVLYPQFLDGRPEVMAKVEFRRALMHAVDRQQMAETLQAGLAIVAHSVLAPNQPGYQGIEAHVPRYEHDPRRSIQLIEQLGYRRAADGIFVDQANRRLSVEILTSNQDINQKTTAAVADFWQRSGVGVETETYPPQRARDLEYHATRSGFILLRHPMDVSSLRSRYRTVDVPQPQNRFAGGNLSRYSHPALDALVERYFVTIPMAERLQVLGEIVQHIADQLPVMGLYYDANPYVLTKRLVNVDRGRSSALTWNVEEWDLK